MLGLPFLMRRDRGGAKLFSKTRPDLIKMSCKKCHTLWHVFCNSLKINYNYGTHKSIACLAAIIDKIVKRLF